MTLKKITATIFLLIFALPALASATGVVQLPQTGQDDGVNAGIPWPDPRFIDNGDQTTTDKLTGLIWTKDANAPGPAACGPSVQKTWWQALDHIKCLNSNAFLGENDWRLPNIYEMESMANIGKINTAEWLTSLGFANVGISDSFQWDTYSRPYWYWSSTPTSINVMYYTERANIVDMKDGTLYPGTYKQFPNYVWPVRGGKDLSSAVQLPQTGQNVCHEKPPYYYVIPCTNGEDGDVKAGVAWPEPRFTENSDQTITDNLVGLTWAKDVNTPGPSICGPAISKSWWSAVDHVKCLNNNNFLGHRDWRLPNRKELVSLFNHNQPNNSTWLSSVGFINTADVRFWSSNALVDGAYYTSYAWKVELNSGFTFPMTMSATYRVLPVRGGQFGNSDIGVLPASGDFGSIKTGESSEPRAFTISNAGTRDLKITSISAAGNDAGMFGISAGTCASLAPVLSPGTNCTVNVTFSPASEGAKSTTLRIASNAPANPSLDVALGGVGIQPDSTPPSGAIVINAGAEYTTYTDVTLSMSATDDSGTVAAMRFSNDNSAWSDWETYNTSKAWSMAAGEGTQTVYIQFEDPVGNTSTFYDTIILDTVPPVAAIIGAPAGPTNSTGATLAISGADVAAYKYKLDTGSYSDEAPVVSPVTLSSLSDGSHTLFAIGRDAAGNWHTMPSAVTWAVDTIVPVVTPPPNVTVEANGPLMQVAIGTATATDAVGVVLIENNAPASFPLGEKIVTWTARDAAGNLGSAPQTITVVDTTPPALAVPANMVLEATSPAGSKAIFTITATDLVDPAPVITCSTASGSTFAFGETTVTCTAKDFKNNDVTKIFTITVRDTTPPVLNVPANITVLLNTPLTAPVVQNFLNGAAAIDTVDPTVTITSTAPEALNTVGAKQVTFTAVDDFGNKTTRTATISVVYGCGGDFLPPVSLLKPFKPGSTIPVKFALCDAFGSSVTSAVARLYLQQYSGDKPVGEQIEVTSTSGADTGNYFRVSEGMYIYNLYTKDLSVGSYQIRVVLDDGAVNTIPLALKQ